MLETSSHTIPPATTATGPFAWICPTCRRALHPDEEGAHCIACDAGYECYEGIWHFLPARRAAFHAAFLTQYETVRRHESWGHPDPAYYRALPEVPPDDPHRGVWQVRARSFDCFVRRVLVPLERRAARPLRVIDLGAGNGWLAHRLAWRGHYAVAVDIQTNVQDGLGACRHYTAPLWPVRAEFDRLPFDDAQFDLVVFNGAVHYAPDYAVTLGEALRILRQEGLVVLLDSPFFPTDEDGRQMVRERDARFAKTFGFASEATSHHEAFLTEARLERLAVQLGFSWTRHRPFYGWRWMLRPWWARLRGRRAPATFPLLVGKRTRVRPSPPCTRHQRLMRSIRGYGPRGRQRFARLFRRRSIRLPEMNPRHGYDRWAHSYGEGMNPIQVCEAEALARLLPDFHEQRVLDVGCGTGRVCRLALRRGAREVVGLDLSDVMLGVAAAASPGQRVQWMQGEVSDLPFPNAAFDAVTAALMMGHVADLDAALGEIARVLRPGGVLVLSDFHPFATLRGEQRSFIDAASGHAFAIEQHLHLFADYMRCFKRLGLALEALEEPLYKDAPIVFVLRARKLSGGGAS